MKINLEIVDAGVQTREREKNNYRPNREGKRSDREGNIFTDIHGLSAL